MLEEELGPKTDIYSELLECMSRYTRRYFLVATAITSLAGCLSDNDDSGQTTLAPILINNRHESPHTVNLRVTWDDEVVHDRTYDIEGNDSDDRRLPGAAPDRTWPDEPGQFTVSARLEGDEWQTIDPEDEGYPECLGITVEIDLRGQLVMKTGQNPMLCSDEFADDGSVANGSSG